MPDPTAKLILTNHETGMFTYRIQDHVADLPFVLEDVRAAHPDLVRLIEAPTAEIRAPFTAEGKLDKVRLAALIEEAKQTAAYHASRAVAMIQAALMPSEISPEDGFEAAEI